MGKCEIIELTTKLFFRTPIKGGGKETGEKQKEEKQGIGILLFKLRTGCQLSIKNRIPCALEE